MCTQPLIHLVVGSTQRVFSRDDSFDWLVEVAEFIGRALFDKVDKMILLDRGSNITAKSFFRLTMSYAKCWFGCIMFWQS